MTHLVVDISKQTLTLSSIAETRVFAVSTALNGIGEIEGSECTPCGRHVISEKIGGELPINAVLRGRQPTGEIYDAELALEHPTRDWILTRILWLSGLDEGMNAGRNAEGINVDSHARYIYIHGTPDSEPMGEPKSHGCIRMRNRDIVELFEQVEVGALVVIVESM
jgi:lipoprotein-anchoring transpeptidase ErfK/SrfK